MSSEVERLFDGARGRARHELAATLLDTAATFSARKGCCEMDFEACISAQFEGCMAAVF